MAKQKEISIPKVGMNRALSPHLLSEGEFAFQLNGNSYDEGGEKFNLTDEHSNILAVKFAEGFKFIGGKNHVVRDKTYVFLTNPETKVSEIGCIVNTTEFTEVLDTEIPGCTECDKNNKEAIPLEEQTQVPHQVYETLLEDSCNLCLGFDIDFPIINILIKEQNIGTKLFWTSTPGDKEFRYLELDDLEQYRVTGDDNCGAVPTSTCLDCDKLRVFKFFSELKIEKYERVLGGNLKKGGYEILGAYSDQVGNEYSSYTSLTPIIPIFDEANVIHEQLDNNAETNFAIKVELANIDIKFDFYKIAVRYYTSRGVFTTFVEGIHGTSDRVIVLSNNNGQPINNTRLAVRRPFVESVDGATVSNNVLVLNGVKEKEPINLQPVINLAGLGIQWMSYRAKENLYANADSYKYVGYNRDENLAFSLDFGFTDGSRTNNFIFIPRPATEDELSEFVTGDDYDSITDIVGDCDGNLRDKKWQFYNTATDLGTCPTNSVIETVTQTESITTYTKIEVPPVPTGVLIDIDLSIVEEISDLKSFIEDNINDPSTLGVIAPYVDISNLTGYNNVPALPGGFCEPFVLDPEEIINIGETTNEKIEYIYPNDASQYASIAPPVTPILYTIDSETNKSEIDWNFSFAYTSAPFIGTDILAFTRKRQASTYNKTCFQAQDLQRITDGNVQSVYSSFFHQNEGALSIALLQNSAINMPASTVSGSVNSVDGVFTNKFHKNALWFKTSVFDREKFYINISENTSCDRETIKVNGADLKLGRNKTSLVRVSVFDKCAALAPIHSELVDLDQHTFIEISSTIISALTNTSMYISVETSIKEATGLGPLWNSNDWVNDDNEYNPQSQNGATFVTTYIANLPCGAWNIVDRNEEPESATISWDEIKLEKTQKYLTSCDFEIPVLKDCEPVPYKYGEMGFYESTSLYPDNEELFNSSTLTINKDKITNADLLTKLDLYKDSETASTITLSEAADFRCKKIRLYKMPDNKVSPFIRTQEIGSNAETIISPLGFTIDGEVISNLLDVAVDNNLITQEQKDNIVNYKLYRSDLTLDRSVVASGLVFNTKKYEIEGEEINYFNYPFNSLGEDKYFPNSEAGDDNSFDKMQVVSPEFDYFKPSLPNEMSIQGFMFGKSNSRILPVEDHAKMVILGKKAKTLATVLASLEATAELAIQIANSAEVYRVQIGLANSVNPTGTVLGIIAASLGAIDSVTQKVGKYRLEWLRTFENLGTPYNFGYYTAAGSNYNYLKTLQTDGDRLRGLSVRKYLTGGMLNISDTTSGKITKLNNIDREHLPFFSLGDFPIDNINPEYVSFDNSSLAASFSSQILSSETGCTSGKSPEHIRNVASPYVAFKNYIPNQFGTITSIKWIDTTFCIPIEETGLCEGVLGGDTFISRHSKKRKVRIFETDLLGSADLTPFPYKFNSNYGDAKYYIDYKVTLEERTGSQLFPNIHFDVHFDCQGNSNVFYVKPPGKFYLYSIAFTNFLCETRINTNFRNARKEPWNQFYPQNSDYESITQPSIVKLTRPEKFFYNKAYLQTNIQNTTFLLPEYYSKENEAKKAYNKNSGIYSLPDANENSITEPWLLYRPNDKFTLTSRYGNLINMKGIESDQILMYFEDALQLQNEVNQYTDGSTSYTADLGNGGMFAKRAVTLRSTDIGYGGTQTKQTLSCEFGHFHADMKRGQIFNYTGSTGMQEVSRYSNGKPNGMDVWFKEHLPLKFAKQFPEFINLDNPYNGVGIHWGYDSKYRRVILTKKDYVLAKGVSFTYDIEENLFDGLTFQEQIEAGNLKEVSWTITYKPETGSWESYMSYTPNYYINHTNYFQSGINSNSSDNGLWSHLLTNKSYRVFYGQKYSYIFEYPVKNQYISKRLESFSWNAQLRRHHSSYDFAVIEANPFTAVTIYNNYENSGNLIPVLNNGTVSQLSKYPITKKDKEQEVLISYDNYRYNLSYFYNRTKSNRNNQPIWLWDENQIDKKINSKAVSFYGKSTLERLKGNFFMVRLERDGNTNYDLDFRWSEQTTNPII